MAGDLLKIFKMLILVLNAILFIIIFFYFIVIASRICKLVLLLILYIIFVLLSRVFLISGDFGVSVSLLCFAIRHLCHRGAT